MTDQLAQWTALVGFLMPLLISIVQQPRWQPRTRALVALMASIAAGVGTVYFTDPSVLDSGVTVGVVLAIVMASAASYNSFWKPVGLRKLEALTSPGDYTLDLEAAIAAEQSTPLD